MRLARWAAIPLALMLLAAAVLPGAALAKTRHALSATGTVETIDEGTVVPVGFDSDGNLLFQVTDRTVTGTFLGPDLTGAYTFTYDAKVTIQQEGKLKGVLTVGRNQAEVKARSQMVAGPAIALLPSGGIAPAAAVAVQGTFEFSKNRLGEGSLSAVVWVELSWDGHIVGILPAGVPLTDGVNVLGFSGPSFVTLTGEDD